MTHRDFDDTMGEARLEEAFLLMQLDHEADKRVTLLDAKVEEKELQRAKADRDLLAVKKLRERVIKKEWADAKAVVASRMLQTLLKEGEELAKKQEATPEEKAVVLSAIIVARNKVNKALMEQRVANTELEDIAEDIYWYHRSVVSTAKAATLGTSAAVRLEDPSVRFEDPSGGATGAAPSGGATRPTARSRSPKRGDGAGS